jgi:hypothetical protein
LATEPGTFTSLPRIVLLVLSDTKQK